MIHSAGARMQFAIAGIQATMQQTVSREMGQQKLHLVGQDSPTREINVLGMRRHERYSQKLHSGFFGRAAAFMMIASFARSDDILPNIPAAFTERLYVISREIRIFELVPAIKA